VFDTQILLPQSESILYATQLLQQWEIVAIPTETIYGLFADATNPAAVQKIFDAKQRPADNPLIIHLAQGQDISPYATISHPLEQLLIDTLMPWPFTLVLPKKDIIPDITTWWLDTVCVRIPDNQIIQDIIRKTGKPLAGPSANTSGRPSPTSAQMVYHDMQWRIPLIIDGWSSHIGIESTVVKVIPSTSGQPTMVKILRPGIITREDIQEIIWDTALVVYADQTVNESPGSRYRHYAPQANVYLWDETNISYSAHEQDNTAIVGTQEFLDELHPDIIARSMLLSLWSINNLSICAHHLYQHYAKCDQENIQRIYIQALPEQGIGYALMNRIRKSISRK